MNELDAVHDIARRVAALDRLETRCELPPLHEQDRTDQEWVAELQVRVTTLFATGPTQELLDSIGAVVVAYKRALAVREDASIVAGDEA